MDLSFYLGLLLAIPLSIVANLLTPPAQRYWAKTSSARKQKRIKKLRAELARLTGEVEPEEPAANQPKETFGLPSSDFALPDLKCLFGGPNVELELHPDAHVYTLSARNAELRYESHVHHLRVELFFRHFRGQEIHVPRVCFALRLKDDPRTYFTALTGLGMNEQATIILCAWIKDRFYAIRHDEPHSTAIPDVELPLGVWEVTATLTADNAKAVGRFKLELRPNNHLVITPLADNSAAKA